MPDIISLAERFANADEGMWGAARSMAYREEVPAKLELSCSASLCEDESKVSEVGVNDITKLRNSITLEEAALEEMVLKPGEVTIDEVAAMPVKTTPKLKVHQSEPQQEAHAVIDDIEFDEALLAKMLANLAIHGMTVQDLAS